MVDTDRTEPIRTALASHKTAAIHLRDSIVDPNVKAKFELPVHLFDDVDRMLTTAAAEPRELSDACLLAAEAILSVAAQLVQGIRRMSDKYGGPENVQGI
jgi:hypothetical protein